MVFVVWCIAASVWYILGLKDISTDPARFNASASLIAIVEILVMLAVAFFIGFGLAWQLQQGATQPKTEQLLDALYRIESRERELATMRTEADQSLQRFQQLEEKLKVLALEKDQQRKQWEGAEGQTALWQKQARELEAKVQQLDGEISSAKFRLRLLENELAEKDKKINELKDDLAKGPAQSAAQVKHREWSDHPFVRPIQENGEIEKDDLTQIKGIGPKFMQKLNALDIFSFRQISELSGEDVERLAEVIEVFPDRIHRDNWIGQATKLYLRKVSQG